jgi:hypothetical protein
MFVKMFKEGRKLLALWGHSVQSNKHPDIS